ncbi:MAG TPA: hypothetical protein VGP72_11840 [Planctomycetota bacterium]|jgi:hypothetical protein
MPTEETNVPSPLLTREQIRERLQKLAQSKPPDNPMVVAMCYKVGVRNDIVEFVCTKCGEKTTYPRPKRWWQYQSLGDIDAAYALEACRRVAHSLPSSQVELDDSQFCRNCCPGVRNPKLVLVVHFANDQAHRFEGLTAEDLRVIHAFLNGQTSYRDSHDAERPLKDWLQRLERIFGAKP